MGDNLDFTSLSVHSIEPTTNFSNNTINQTNNTTNNTFISIEPTRTQFSHNSTLLDNHNVTSLSIEPTQKCFSSISPLTKKRRVEENNPLDIQTEIEPHQNYTYGDTLKVLPLQSRSNIDQAIIDSIEEVYKETRRNGQLRQEDALFFEKIENIRKTYGLKYTKIGSLLHPKLTRQGYKFQIDKFQLHSPATSHAKAKMNREIAWSALIEKSEPRKDEYEQGSKKNRSFFIFTYTSSSTSISMHE